MSPLGYTERWDGVDRMIQRLRTVVGRSAGTSRYDLVLAVIPAAFVVAGVLGTTSAMTPATAVSAGGLVSALAVIDALFLNPPRRPSADRGRR